MDNILNKFVENLKNVYKENLKSIILYGSAARGEYVDKYSDYNILVVLLNLNFEELSKISKIANKWVQHNNPVPLVLTVEQINESLDVFPIEFLDIKDNHKILYGEDIFTELQINTENLRLECEHELRGKFLKLRQMFILTDGNHDKIKELIIHSSSTFFVLFKAVLRLFGEKPGIKNIDVIKQLSGKIQLNTEIFINVLRLKENQKEVKDINIEKLMFDYTSEIEKIIESVNVLRIS